MKPSNKIICDDSLTILRSLPSDSIHLIYLDPPFYTKRHFVCYDGDSRLSFSDKWSHGLTGYLSAMHEILDECRRLLRNTGSLYLHCDSHASHYLKVTADQIFGYGNFRNEIIWKRHNSHNDSKQGCKQFGKVHDTILHYSKSDNYLWHQLFKAYSPEYIEKYYRHQEPVTGRRYALGDLTGPGGEGKGNPHYEFMGKKKFWRYSREKMLRLKSEGRIECNPRTGTPYLKRYLDDMRGRPIQDIWDDIISPQLSKKGYNHYPTQKPVQLLERIIESSSNTGDIVLDPFCGSGTTLIAAEKLGRNWIGIDSSPEACTLTSRRFKTEFGKEVQVIRRNVLRVKN